ncbi:D-alanyl-D-alanine carboxypeptidase family protein [Agathobacter sp.]
MIIFFDKKKPVFSKLLCIVIVINMFILIKEPVDAQSDAPQLHAVAAALYDADNGTDIYARNANESMANASTTKILTCIVALENAGLDDMVTVSAEAAAQPQVKLGLKEGQSYNMKDLMYGMMLESYNDCAYAIAEYVGGSVDGFAQLLNQKANSIGCYGTYFLTPNGLDKEDEISFHHTTANDLCVIMSYCAWNSPKSPEFLEITETTEYQYQDEAGQHCFKNHNRLLTETDYVISGKTGFTAKAGYCYVAAIEKDGRRMCLSLLGCGWPNNKNYKWEDAKKLVEYGTGAKDSFSTAVTDKTADTEMPAENKTENKMKNKNILPDFANYFTINLGFFY